MGEVATRRVRAAVGVAVLGLLVSDALAFRTIANRARPVALQTVIARYRQQSTTPGAAVATVSLPIETPATPAPTVPPRLRPTTTRAPVVATTVTPIAALIRPAAGVYVYDTSGHEDTNAVGGAHHAYPAQTAITVTSSPCGFTMRWDALQQRWDEWSACVSGRQLTVQGERMKHAFYGVSDERQYACTGAMFRPGPETSGTPIGGRCAGSGDNAVWSGRVVGLETVTVAGQAVAAIHIVVQETVNGATDGVRHSDNWFAATSGLLLKRIASVEGDSSTAAGRVHYSETVTLQLTSLVPAR